MNTVSSGLGLKLALVNWKDKVLVEQNRGVERSITSQTESEVVTGGWRNLLIEKTKMSGMQSDPRQAQIVTGHFATLAMVELSDLIS